MQFKKLLFFMISVSILISGCDSKPEESKNEEITKNEVNQEQSKYILKTTTGQNLNIQIKDKSLKINELPNKAILVNFWATWCPPCKAEIPHLINLKNKYKENFEILALNVGDKNADFKDTSSIDSFIKEYKINYLVTSTEENLKIAKTLGEVKIIPTMFLFDAKGTLIQKYVGVVPEEMMETDIKKALGKE